MSALRILRRQVRAVVTHPANQGRPVRSLARVGRHFVETRALGRRTTAPLGQRSRIIVDPSRPASSRVAIGNPPDPAEMRVLQRLIRPGDLFVDVGANIGIYTIFVADLGGEVLALEPVHTDHLEENLSLNGYDVTIVEKAASNLVGELRFSLDRDQENSILLDGAADEAAMVVPATTVDTELGDRHARVVKIDVEGFERLVVEGMERCLSERRVDAVQLEWNRASEDALSEDRHPVAAALIEHGYRLTLPDNSGALAPCSGAYNADESIDIFALSPALAGSVLGPE